MLGKFSVFRFVFKTLISFSMCSEYADEALKQGKVFQEVAKEKLEVVATEAVKSKVLKQRKKTEMKEFFVHL